VVELDKPAPPVRLVAQQPARPASPPPETIDDVAIVVELPPEETISIEDLAAELSDEDIAPLDLPTELVAVDEPIEALDVEGEAAELEIEVVDADELMVESGFVEDEETTADAVVEALDGDNSVLAPDDEAPKAAAEPVPAMATGTGATATAPAESLAPPVNSLEALMRRRGLSAAAHVEEVEVTARG
jgi:hypothetical protein